MSAWGLFSIQRTTVAAVVLAVVMHAFVIVVLTQLSIRPRTDFDHDQERMNPSIQVLLLTGEMAALRATVIKNEPTPVTYQPMQKQREFALARSVQNGASHPLRHKTQKETRSAVEAPHELFISDDSLDRLTGSNSRVAEKVQQRHTDHHISPSNINSTVPEQDSARAIHGARPDYSYNPQPDYPLLLREQGLGGVVWLRVWVDSEGQPGEIKLSKGSGYRLLDEAALLAVKKWRFIPAKNGDQNLASWVEFPIRFTLNG